MATPDITVYWLNTSRADRIIWLLEELNLPYKTEVFHREGRMAPPSAKAIHPLGKFPVVKVNDEVLAESAFISEILCERYGQWLIPENEEEKLRYRYFSHYVEGSLMPPMLVGLILHGMKNAQVPFFIKPVLRFVAGKVEDSYVHPNYETHLAFLEGELSKRQYLTGDKITGVDILIQWPLNAATSRMPQYSEENYPNIAAYLKRLTEREAFKNAAEKISEMGGPSKSAL